MAYRGSCHCGKVAFEVQGEPDGGLACNCSMCRRRGSLLWFTGKENFKLLTAEADASTYLFNKHHIRHRFCAACGIHPFGEASGRDGKPVAAINLRCLEDFDFTKVPVQHFDGAAL